MRLFRLLLSAVALFAVACQQDVETPAPEPTPEKSEFEVVIHETTRGSVTFSVEPRDEASPYLCVVYSKSRVEEFTREEFLVEAIYQELRDEASGMGKTLEEYMPEIVDRGTLQEARFSQLMADTDYYILVFGVDDAKGYDPTINIYIKFISKS